MALSACPTPVKDVGGGAAQPLSNVKANAAGSPSEAMMAILMAARANDVEAFKKGLSKNFILTIERLQELSTQKPELKNAFSWQTFIRTLAKSQAIPSEQRIKGKKATVLGTDINGQPVRTQMVLEDGAWKLQVPGGMVKALDNLDHFAEQVKGTAKPELDVDIKRGGGGKGGRVRGLAEGASEADKAKALALDTFDLGDLAGAEQALDKALKLTPDDEELNVAKGRVLVQLGKGKEALAVFEAYSKKHPDSSPSRHYLGMAYMMDNRAMDAANAWREVVKRDPEYAAKFKLDDRANKAEGIAKAGAAPAPAPKAPSSAPAPK